MATAGLLFCEFAAFCTLQLPSANTLYAHIFRAEEIAQAERDLVVVVQPLRLDEHFAHIGRVHAAAAGFQARRLVVAHEARGKLGGVGSATDGTDSAYGNAGEALLAHVVLQLLVERDMHVHPSE